MGDARNPLYPPKIGPYLLKEVIGHGNTCIVVRAKLKGTNNFYACKIVSKQYFVSSNHLKHFHDELTIMQKLEHPNILKLFGIYEDTINYYVFEEICNNGDLGSYIIKTKIISEPQAASIMYQIFKAVDFMHSNQIAHRDIKPENILLDDKLTIKVADFGFSSMGDPNSFRRTLCGTLHYVSPEVLSGNPYNPYKADSWSCGVMLYAIVTGLFPWKKRGQSALIHEIMSADILVPQSVSADCKDLILKLCDRNPETRISIHDALKHPFIQQCAQAREDQLSQSPRGRSESLPLPPLPGRKIRCIPENCPYKNDNISQILAMCHRKPPKNVKGTTAASIIIPTHILPISRNSSSTSLVVNRLKCRKQSSLLIGPGNLG